MEVEDYSYLGAAGLPGPGGSYLGAMLPGGGGGGGGGGGYASLLDGAVQAGFEHAWSFPAADSWNDQIGAWHLAEAGGTVTRLDAGITGAQGGAQMPTHGGNYRRVTVNQSALRVLEAVFELDADSSWGGYVFLCGGGGYSDLGWGSFTVGIPRALIFKSQGYPVDTNVNMATVAVNVPIYAMAVYDPTGNAGSGQYTIYWREGAGGVEQSVTLNHNRTTLGTFPFGVGPTSGAYYSMKGTIHHLACGTMAPADPADHRAKQYAVMGWS